MAVGGAQVSAMELPLEDEDTRGSKKSLENEGYTQVSKKHSFRERLEAPRPTETKTSN